MSKERHAARCTCSMKPKIYRRKNGWRVECGYCGTVGICQATKDMAIEAWDADRTHDAEASKKVVSRPWQA